MDIGTEKADRIVNVGSAGNLYSLYSTAATLMGQRAKKVALGLAFLEHGSCASKDCAKTLKQLSEIKIVLEKHAPTEAVWDMEHPNILAPWNGHLSPDISSCADLYTTSEGELLIGELVSLLQFAGSSKQSVVVLG
ncbi:hypothetical protein GMI70_10135 [Eggerthellaceae bacterium zg-893]|nr:hypothetical protein [Eggerthellaceae bacterium zg-893]